MIAVGEIKNNRYCIIERIGSGGTSNVYYVKDNRLGKFWALKEIGRSGGLGEMLASRELDMLRSIDFDMFPKIVDAWQDSQAVYLVCDYVEGTSLDNIIRDIPVSFRQTMEWSLQILSALEYLHNLSPPILYLDLKPENIMVKKDGTLALVDFGIAGRIATRQLPLGTPGYAAPEQYGGDEGRINERTDIYSFGMTYLSIRNGGPPLPDKKDIYSFISECSVLSNKEKSFLKKCIAYDNKDRYSNASVVMRKLKNLSNSHKLKRRTYLTVSFVLSIGLISVCLLSVAHEKRLRQEAAIDMVNKANAYMEDGSYTYEGIKIIVAFLNSACLPEDTQQYYTYEVAKFYFEELHDYAGAYRFFKLINQELYPEAKFYLEICSMEMNFKTESNDMMNCVGEFYRYVRGSGLSLRRTDNMMLIAQCYEKYEPLKIEGIKKAITILRDEEKFLEDNGTDTAEYRRCKEKLTEQIDNLMAKAEYIALQSIK